MKKIMLLSFVFVGGLFAAQNTLAIDYGVRESFFESNSNSILKNTEERSLHNVTCTHIHNHHHHGHSGWSLVGCFAGGVVVTVGTLGALAYLGYDHVKPDVKRFLDLGEHGIKILGAIGKGVGEAATTSK